MPKRPREEVQDDLPPAKRTRGKNGSSGRLSTLSNELLLHILSFLPMRSLNVCQRISRRFYSLGADSELWKRQYYTQWVRPRARRLANARRSSLPVKAEYTPKVSTWLDHSHLADKGKVTNWKRQYRLRHNWAIGSCRVTEAEIPHPSSPPVIIKLFSGFVFTADTVNGLRVWAAKDPTCCLAKTPLSDTSESRSRPSALAVGQHQNEQEILIGFENGRFTCFFFDINTCQLRRHESHVGFRDGAITAMALSPPYLLMVSQHKLLSLYDLGGSSHPSSGTSEAKGLRELASLRADSMIAPVTLSIRVSAMDIVASIAYSFFHIGCGWALGIQELRFDKNGQQLDSRLVSTVDSQYGIRPFQDLPPSNQPRHSAGVETLHGPDPIAPAAPSILHRQPPTSMSYSHPYLLTSHADNTLTMYLVVSTSDSLFVRGGQRLWGHTSSVSGVQVTNRGKAVSVSARGDEVRVWELETAVPSLNSRRALKEQSSVQISPEKYAREDPRSGYVLQEPQRGRSGIVVPSAGTSADLPRIYECVGFDEERVILLREKGAGTQLLECYDFT
ncbi:hypothetical protein N7492_009313 [Penicillium capsulatum]|uniref:Probable E3 ubiquitin ligase complex SCF subunit sconB n=1 Tax=Penicillium capsulatum TaxID=69766 RepID=A0A9W9HUN1_9EURO|nr:hypothetical protein N7492_009313 [Penicillium capsulatum]KAJ6106707.1 hypothetical protein N7512_010224 [Penicillium capsulatum]